MSADSNKYSGVFAVLSVPYTDDFAIDTAVLKTEIDFAIDHGIHGLVIAMVSEIFRLTDAERDALVAATVQAADGRVPVISSVGAESFVQLRRHAEAAVDALLERAAVAPFENEVRAHTRRDWGGYSGYFADPDGYL